jgi:selenocysteine lyase/cysteine desulfurase
MLDTDKIHKYFHIDREMVCANTSSCGLLPKSCNERLSNFTHSLQKSGSRTSENFLSEILPKIRTTVSEFFDADKSEVALIPNFSFGLNSIIPSISRYKKALLFEDDYPSLTQPFVLNDFEVTWLKSGDGFSFELEEIAKIISEKKIEIVAISQVQYLTGFMIDIEAVGKVCKANGAVLIIDGTQSLGAITYSFSNSHADIYIASNYKWMNAGFGTGIMAIKKDFLQRHEPKIGGFASFLNEDGSWGYKPSILCYEPGHLNMGGLLVLEDSINIKLQLGMDNIQQHIRLLIDLLVSQAKVMGLEIIGPYSNENRCGIVCFRDSEALSDSLLKHNILFKSRGGKIRIGLHFHNTEEDVHRILRAMEFH